MKGWGLDCSALFAAQWKFGIRIQFLTQGTNRRLTGPQGQRCLSRLYGQGIFANVVSPHPAAAQQAQDDPIAAVPGSSKPGARCKRIWHCAVTTAMGPERPSSEIQTETPPNVSFFGREWRPAIQFLVYSTVPELGQVNPCGGA